MFACLGIRQSLVRAELKSPHYLPSLELTAEEPNHPLALEKPEKPGTAAASSRPTVVTPPYHKPANLPGDWWRRYHRTAQNRGDFNTEECQECHSVEKYCNRCHGYLGVKPVVSKDAAVKAAATSRPADG